LEPFALVSMPISLADPLEKERDGAKELSLFLPLDGDDMPTPIDGNDSNIT